MPFRAGRLTAAHDVTLALGGLFAMAAGIGIGRFIYTPILPPMVEALGLSKSSAGLIASANFIGYLIGALFAAYAHLPGSRRTWLLGSLAVSTVTTGWMGFTDWVPAFLVLRLAGGVASALILILASALVLEQLAQSGRTALTGVHFAGVGIGIAVSAGAVAAVQAGGMAWPALWLTGAALSLVATILVWLLIPDPGVKAQQMADAGGTQTSRGLRMMIGAYGLFGFGYVITATFIVSIVRAAPAVRPLEPIIWIVVGLSAAPSLALWTWLADRIGVQASFGLAAVAEAIGVMASVAWQSTIGILAAAILLGGTFMGLTALGLMRARALSAGDPRQAIAKLTGSFGVGQIIGPVFAGMLYDYSGSFALPSYVAAAGLVVAAILAQR
ncbi:MAG TPA: YbfB/YjiJ family MFS transporter [Acetobacteraceae bacterium]|nr:YbfB/YjiJ family MFS transporter [Acetobacteraceae bacterium]